jgi:hypothetical protein
LEKVRQPVHVALEDKDDALDSVLGDALKTTSHGFSKRGDQRLSALRAFLMLPDRPDWVMNTRPQPGVYRTSSSNNSSSRWVAAFPLFKNTRPSKGLDLGC